MHANVLHRCGDHPCPPEGCDQDRLDRDSAGTGAGTRPAVPRSVYQTLASPGQPLDAGMRHTARSWFGADFASVRVHTDPLAAQSAREVDSNAYTVGEHIVFGSGRYQLGTATSQRILAHELSHVLQQRAASTVPGRPLTVSHPHDADERHAEHAAEAVLSGQAAPVGGYGHPAVLHRDTGTTTTTFSAPPNVCSPDQTRQMIPAVTTAQQWLNTADNRLSAYLSADPKSPASNATGLSMLRHIAASDAQTVRYVLGMIRRIAERLRTDSNALNSLTTECHGASDSSCTSAGAYVQGNLLVFCPSFADGSAEWKAGTMIHEIAHSLLPAGPMHITDRAYPSDRLYARRSPGEALTNAASYELLVRELATGLIGATAPQDTYEDCPTDWRAALATATARAERWNRDAQVVMHDQRPAFLAGWTALATRHLGGQTPAQVSSAATVYDGAFTKLQSRVDFECEPDGGGRCDTSSTYWYALGDFHVCPSWRRLATDDDRAESLLAGLYGYYRLVDDNTRRRNLAALARALHYQFWAPPTAADVTSALTTAATTPLPPAAPPPGPAPGL